MLAEWNWQMITGISASVIALCALITSILHGVHARKHNQLSCRPHLTTWSHNGEREGIYVVELLNNGLGPALIKSFIVKVDGEIISGKGTKPIEAAVEMLFPREDYSYSADYAYMNKGYAMSAKDRCRVVIIQFQGEFQPPGDDVEATLNRADLVVEYKSFYGESRTYNSADERAAQ